jgi:hypothetical protein
MPTNIMASFDNWIGGRNVQSLGTNAGTDAIPFQSWRHFKEAFAPELVRRAIAESPIPVTNCLDPFGGSGTTALSCQFLGVRPTIIEVNLFLTDLIEAKLAHYDPESIARDFGKLVKKANALDLDPIEFYSTAPLSFVEPGVKNLDLRCASGSSARGARRGAHVDRKRDEPKALSSIIRWHFNRAE